MPLLSEITGITTAGRNPCLKRREFEQGLYRKRADNESSYLTLRHRLQLRQNPPAQCRTRPGFALLIMLGELAVGAG
jgi:hypothetical protein